MQQAATPNPPIPHLTWSQETSLEAVRLWGIPSASQTPVSSDDDSPWFCCQKIGKTDGRFTVHGVRCVLNRVLKLRFIKWRFFTKKTYGRTRIYEIHSKNGNLENQESSCHLDFYPWVCQPWPGVGAFEFSDPRIHPFFGKKKVEIPGVKLSNYQKSGWISDELEKKGFTNLDLSMGVLGGFTL